MTNKVKLSEKFKASFAQIIQNDILIPKGFYQTTINKLENLKIFPRMYQKIEINEYRKIPIYNYIMLYEVQKNYIRVVDIVSTKSNYFNKIY